MAIRIKAIAGAVLSFNTFTVLRKAVVMFGSADAT